MNDVIEKVKKLIALHKEGKLGGERMPEDSNPNLAKNSEENFLYFTLPMALNYQRNSYKLWEAALQTYADKECCDVFCPQKVVEMSDDQLKQKLTKHQVALQPNKQPIIWRTLCQTFENHFDGSVKKLFAENENDIKKIKDYILQNKKMFPYLSGTKILNYWLYVMTQQTGVKFKNRQEISVAPDTHILQASVKLGMISQEDLTKSNIREIVSERWKTILEGTNIQPIDVHTPFWLWSRNGFKIEV